MNRRQKARRQLVSDLLFILIGVIIAALLSQTGLISRLVVFLGGEVAASFVAGIFFTSAFTLVPAALALVHIAEGLSVHTMAFWGALGAMCGDLLLFLFIRDRFAADIVGAMKPALVRHVANSFHFGLLKWISPIIGGLIIASPLPDEFGLALLGLSKTRAYILVPVAFFMNMVNIYLLVWFAHLL